MNWTGGRLSRAAGKGENSVVKKQKQHFAKVRSRALHGHTSNSPAKWSIFDNITVEVNRREAPSRQGREESRHHHYSPDRHSRSHHLSTEEPDRKGKKPQRGMTYHQQPVCSI